MLREISNKLSNIIKTQSCNQLLCRFNSGEGKVLQNIDTMKCINKVTLLGRATAPVNIVQINNTEMVNFILATNEIRRNKSDVLVKHSEFHRIQVFSPRLISRCRAIIDKGSRVFVDGKINYNIRKDEQTNNTIVFTNIVAENIIFFTGNRDSQDLSGDVDEQLDVASEN